LLFLHDRSETLQTTMDVGFDRTDRPTRRLADLGDSETDDMAENDRYSLRSRQSTEPSIPLGGVDRVGIVGHHVYLGSHRRSFRPVSEMVPSQIQGDRPDPRFETEHKDPLPVVSAQCPVGADQRFLSEILGFLMISR